MRFRAPPRAAVGAAFSLHPVVQGFAALSGLIEGDWPDCEALNALLGVAHHPASGARLRFVPQTDDLAGDGLHYEARIFLRGEIATRTENWHDLFNALCWLERRVLKCAINGAYVQDLQSQNSKDRSRRQAALTHFDEAGAVVFTRSPARLAAWDAHDWQGLFMTDRAALATDFRLVVFGHALLEHCLEPAIFPVAKCVVVDADALGPTDPAVAELANAIIAGQVLMDPQELRPLPLAGFPGWHTRSEEPGFYRDAPCFQPCRPGRLYPQPWTASRSRTAP